MTEAKKGIGKAGVGLVILSALAVVLTISNLLVYATLQKQISTLNTENNSLGNQVSSLQTDKNYLQSENSQLENEVSSLRYELNDLKEPELHKVGVYWNDNRPLFASPYVNIYGCVFNSGSITAYSVVYTVRIYDAYDTLLKTEQIHLGHIAGKSYETFDVDIEYSGDADRVTSSLTYD